MQLIEIADLLKQLRTLDSSLLGLLTSLEGAPAPSDLDPFTFERRLRDARHNHALLSGLSDSAWEIMLELEAARRQQQPRAVSDLCCGRRIPLTTVLRQLDRLCASGLVERTTDTGDRRRIFVGLTALGRKSIEEMYGKAVPKGAQRQGDDEGFREYPGESVFAA